MGSRLTCPHLLIRPGAWRNTELPGALSGRWPGVMRGTSASGARCGSPPHRPAAQCPRDRGPADGV